MKFGSVCSGIEAASVAWEPLGWSCAFVAEIDPAPSAVLAHRYPGVPNRGDFTTITEDVGPIDLLVGGTPCQSFSVAGKRLGLDDPRGNLAIEFLRLARRLRPLWVVWENVPGILSSGEGRDFGAYLGFLGQLGYGWAYRVLDAQHFGVPQRRRRVFVVGCLGDWRGAAAVLFERESLSGNPPPSRAQESSLAPSVTPGARRASGQRSGECLTLAPTLFASNGGASSGHHPVIADTLKAHHGRGREDDTYIPDLAYCVAAADGRGKFGSGRDGQDTFVAHTLRADGFDASEDGTGRGTPLVPVAYQCHGTNVTSWANRSRVEPGLPCHTLHAAPPSVIGVGVRRLTPRECERLQGFSDEWTLVPYRGKPMADGPRYKMIGNSMAVPVVRWLGRRLDAVNVIL